LFATVATQKLLRDLTPASGRQDHTTSPYAKSALVESAIHVHRLPRPTSVTIAIRPSCGCGMAEDGEVIWLRGKPESFCRQDWTGRNSLNCFNKSSYSRMRISGLDAPNPGQLRHKTVTVHLSADRCCNVFASSHGVRIHVWRYENIDKSLRHAFPIDPSTLQISRCAEDR
jgi:hypothetical protein